MRKRKYSEDYYKMLHEHAAKLTDIHRNGKEAPWEWSYGLDYLVEFLRGMADYYERGENVWGAPTPDRRLETIKLALYYYDKWMNLEEEYITVVHHPETYKSHDNGDGTVTVDDLGFHCEYKYGPKGKSQRARRRAMLITYKKLNKAQCKYRKKFFMTLNKYIESWWD